LIIKINTFKAGFSSRGCGIRLKRSKGKYRMRVKTTPKSID